MVKVIKFSAEWCHPCHMYKPIFDEVSQKMGHKAEFKQYDIDKDDNVTERYKIRSIPTTIIEKDGEIVYRYSGTLDKTTLITEIEIALGEAIRES